MDSIATLVSQFHFCIAFAVPHFFRVSCGAQADVESPPTYTLWHKDASYTGGLTANATLPSDITPTLKTVRFFPISFGPTSCYNFARIPKGRYSITIFFGLVKLSGEPIYDISIEGTEVYSLLPGWSNHDDQAFSESLISLLNGTATICFHSVGHGDPTILAIQLLQIHDMAYDAGQRWDKRVVFRTVIRLNCGARKPKFDEDYGGNIWGANRFWTPAGSFAKNSGSRIYTENSIANVSASPNFFPEQIYQSALVSTDEEPDMTFIISVKALKTYWLWFHFAEINSSITEGKRVFDIIVNDKVVCQDVDIFRMGGQGYTAVVLNVTIAVTENILRIVLHPRTGHHALMNAIEILEVVKREFQTTRDEANGLKELKKALGVPSLLGWNGDPCAPVQHSWSGVKCENGKNRSTWVIATLDLHRQGLKGFLPMNVSRLSHLKSINLSYNSICGTIPESLGDMKSLEVLDLSYNSLNGSIPESLGSKLTSLRILKLEGNVMLEKGSALTPNNPQPSHHRRGMMIIIIVSLTLLTIVAIVCATIWWRRKQDVTRAQPYTRFPRPQDA
ncbi:unnamed protein product [Microthlaspi erraticum]|uniref:Malectin-like domain-containing protein n=1 Tax=Microthlaspi erraticum TaxID=1685480 RepID=A0A6D2IZI6_9BRAS|nr:unnamed protein product [Microthlaspi erraticum]